MLPEELVRNMAKPLFYTRMRTGEFDTPEMNPYAKYNLSLVQSLEHRQLAIKSAMKSYVLLKNDGLLPINKTFKRIAVSFKIMFQPFLFLWILHSRLTNKKVYFPQNIVLVLTNCVDLDTMPHCVALCPGLRSLQQCASRSH